jgi:hypothetical protein
MKVVQLAWPLSGYKPLKLGSHVPKHRRCECADGAVDVHVHCLSCTWAHRYRVFGSGCPMKPVFAVQGLDLVT